MKNREFIIVTVLCSLLLISLNSHSQFTCGGAYPSEEIVPDGSCSFASSSYDNKYNDLSFYIPDENTPIKTILVNINIFQKSDGTGNWQNIPDHINRLNQVMTSVNSNYTNIPPPSDPLPGVQHITDSKLRFELNAIYFYQDDATWATTYASVALNKIESTDPTRLEQLNVCITGGDFWATGYANFPSKTVFSQNSYVMTFGNDANPVQDWALALHLAHEFGHNIELHHTYNSDACSFTDPDFLDDVFGTVPCPTAPPGCDICYHDAGWDCDAYDPSNTCTNNMMGGTQSMSYLSPKQIGKIHRAMSVRSVRRYVKEAAKSETPLEITSDETWDFNIQLYSDIIVKSGATLTITCKVLMPPEGRIIVERNAKLIVDEGEITGAYETLWRGIEVWGNPNYAHDTPEPHGIVETKNGAIISNAKHAITTTRKDENGFVVSGYHGGIIKADQTTFENNKRAAEFWPFAYENASYFTRCSFLTSEALFDNNEFDYFIIMSDIEGVTIQGCDFENTRPANDVYIEDRGIGIYSTECQFKIDEYEDPVGGNIENQFIALDYGIKALGLTSSKAPDIRCCSFDFNRTGVYFSGITSGSVLLSDFQVEMFDQSYNQNIYCGLYLDNSTQYHIEANTFWHATNTPATETHVIGITVNNSGESNNEIYRNTFKALDIGILAQNNNRNANGSRGLVLKCNDFGDNNVVDPSLNDNTYDIAVTDDGQYSNPGIKKSQGSDAHQASPAGNRFSHAGNGIINSDFCNEGSVRVFYYQHDPTNEPRVNLIYYSPLEITKMPTSWPFEEPICCPSEIISVGTDDLKSAMAANENKADSVDLLLDALVDGGNTQQLESDVILSSPDDAYLLYTDLMNKSPYLTDTVMVEAVNKEDVLNEVMVKDILVANPQSAKSDEVSTELDNRINPLPEYMIEEIEDGENILGDKETMESNKTFFLHQQRINRNHLVSIYKTNITGFSYRDTLINFLSAENELNSRYELAFEHLFNQDFSNASNVLSSIPNDFMLNSQEVDIFNKYQDYLSVLISLKQGDKFIDELDTNQISLLNSIATNLHSFPDAYARNALLYIDEFAYSEPYILPDSTLKAEEYSSSSKSPGKELPSFEIYPNPANNFITIEYDITSQTVNGYFEIFNIDGRMIEKVELSSSTNSQIIHIDEKYTNGMYLCRIICNGEVIGSEKLTILK